MSQRDTLRAMDASIMAAFHGAGLADDAVYTPPAGAPAACRVYVDRAAQFFGGETADIAGYRTTVTIFRSDVDRPQRGGRVAIGTGETFELEKIDAQDESMSRWVVIT